MAMTRTSSRRSLAEKGSPGWKPPQAKTVKTPSELRPEGH
jgi:hypothetical protein